MKPVSSYEMYCIGMTVHEALEILIEMEAEEEKIIITTQDGNKYVTIWDYCNGVPGSVQAESIEPIQFCGGPPGQYFWVVGSLKTLIMDRLMYKDAIIEVRNGSNVA
jgi:hypothetical protein